MISQTRIYYVRLWSRGVSGLATDSPCGVWGRGWTTCLLHDSPLFASHFKMRVDMYVWSDISYIYNFLLRFTVSCIKLVIFLLYNHIFIYQVLCTLIYRRRSLYSFLFVLPMTSRCAFQVRLRSRLTGLIERYLYGGEFVIRWVDYQISILPPVLYDANDTTSSCPGNTTKFKLLFGFLEDWSWKG